MERAKLNWRKIFNQAIQNQNENKNMAFGNFNTLGGMMLDEHEEERFYDESSPKDTPKPKKQQSSSSLISVKRLDSNVSESA